MPSWFAVATPGLEPVVARELDAMGISGEVVVGGVQFQASLAEGARLSAAVRTPARIVLRVAEGTARSLQGLADLIRTVDWSGYLMAGAEVDVTVSTRASRLSRRDVIATKARNAIRDATRGFKRRRPPRIPQRLQVRIDSDHVTLSLDAGGELLHRRGWRQSAGKAPLRENLAAAMLMAAGWSGDEALVDPFCGSGTLPIEAALLAAGRAPWSGRSFAWEEWPALEGIRPSRDGGQPVRVPIIGSDREPRAIQCCLENAERARVTVDWRVLDVSEVQAPAQLGLVATNPPYGARLGQRVRGVYHHFGRTLQDRFEGWRVIFLAPNDRLAGAVHPEVTRLTTFSNGGLRVGVFVIEQV
jgi:putative N6-adenine-specific DNA methylase